MFCQVQDKTSTAVRPKTGVKKTMFAIKAFSSTCSFALAMLLASNAPAQQTRSNMIAIDVLIEVDAAMIDKANTVNARLRQNYPQGYALDAAHAPHITLVQRFVRTSDLNAVAIAVTEAARSGPTLPIKLTATGFASTEWGGVGVVVYLVDRSPELLQLASKIEEAVRPFAVSGGSADAFAKAPGEEINADTIKYVEEFVPASIGQKYLPHVTLGTAHPDFVKALEAAPFEKFAFSGVNIAIYQLGNFGTAQKRLWARRQQ
jgi:hypothetical protein